MSPKGSPEGPQGPPKRHPKATRSSKGSPKEPQRIPRAPPGDPTGPQGVPRDPPGPPKEPQESPRETPRSPRGAPGSPRIAQRSLKGPPEAPREPRGPPKGSPWHEKYPKMDLELNQRDQKEHKTCQKLILERPKTLILSKITHTCKNNAKKILRFKQKNNTITKTRNPHRKTHPTKWIP